MRILLRQFDDKEYVWKEATYENGNYLVEGEGAIGYTRIVAVDGLYENKVMCKNCGAIIDNTPEAVMAHYKEREAQVDCSKCEHLTFGRNRTVTNRTMKKVDSADDLFDFLENCYEVTETFTSPLYCEVLGYRTAEVNRDHIESNCTYGACRRKGVGQLPDIFHKYPGIFDAAITSDVLLKKKYTCDGYADYCRAFEYDMKCRGTVKALVNKLGIVDRFAISYRGKTVYYAYSEKYDRLFWVNGAVYREDNPYWMPETKLAEVKKKIKALYEEANKND